MESSEELDFREVEAEKFKVAYERTVMEVHKVDYDYKLPLRVNRYFVSSDGLRGYAIGTFGSIGDMFSVDTLNLEPIVKSAVSNGATSAYVLDGVFGIKAFEKYGFKEISRTYKGKYIPDVVLMELEQ